MTDDHFVGFVISILAATNFLYAGVSFAENDPIRFWFHSFAGALAGIALVVVT